MKQMQRISKQQEGVVLFIAMVMVLILASLTVTTAQVSRQATKFAQANDAGLRSDLAKLSVTRDVNTALAFVNNRVPRPVQEGAGWGWQAGSTQAPKEGIKFPLNDKPTAYYYFTLADYESTTFLPETDLKCATSGSTMTLPMGHVSEGGAAPVDFPLNLNGHCRAFLRDDSGDLVTGFDREDSIPWLSVDWLNFNTDDLEFIDGCDDVGNCYEPGRLADNNPVIQGSAQNLFNTDIDNAGAVQGDLHLYKNYIGPNNLPEYMIETFTENPGGGAAAGLTVSNAGGSLSGEAVKYFHRLTFAGYAGYIDDDPADTVDGRVRSVSMHREIRIVLE